MSELHIQALGPDANWGRALAYHPLLAHFFGSVNAGILFGQLAYWQVRADSPLGVYKSAEDWTDETGLTYREQATARKILSEPGFLVETNRRLEHRIYYRIDWTAFNPAFREWFETRGAGLGGSLRRVRTPNDESATGERSAHPSDESAIPGRTKVQAAAAQNSKSLIGTESTAQSTADIDCSDPASRGLTGALPKPPKKLKHKTPIDPESVKVVGTLPLRSGGCFEVTKSDVARWAKAFPLVNVKQSLIQMKTWLQDNPDRLKTRRGIKRAINHWLTNDQGAGGGGAPRDPKGAHYAAPRGQQRPPPPEVHAKAPVVQKLR